MAVSLHKMAISAMAVADVVFEEIATAATAHLQRESCVPGGSQHVHRRYDGFAILTEDHLSKLSFLFGKNLERAMEILDFGGVRRIVAQPSGRSVFQVQGKSKGTDQYVCFPRHFCACHSFFFDVVGRAEQLCCKHQLAARLAQALQCCPEVQLSDAALASILLSF